MMVTEIGTLTLMIGPAPTDPVAIIIFNYNKHHYNRVAITRKSEAQNILLCIPQMEFVGTYIVALGSADIIFSFPVWQASRFLESSFCIVRTHPWERLPGPRGVISYKSTSSEIFRDAALFPLRESGERARRRTTMMHNSALI